MYKSFVPGCIPLIIIAIFLLSSEKGRRLFNLKTLLACGAIILVIISPWLVARSIHDHAFIGQLLGLDYWNRLTKAVDNHSAPPWYYLNQMVSGFTPWIYLLPFGLFLAIRGYRKERNHDYLFLLIWIIVVFCIFSVPMTKNFWYILPMYPAAALLVALLWSMLFREAWRSTSRSEIIPVLVGLFGIGFMIGIVQTDRAVGHFNADNNYFSSFIDTDPVREEILHSQVSIQSYVATQSNVFYLERLLGDRFNISPDLRCSLQKNERWFLSTDQDFLREFLNKCPQRKVVTSYATTDPSVIYFLIR